MKNLAAVLFTTSLAACSAISGGGDGNGPGGKADNAASCDDEGRNCLDTRSHEVLFTNPICAELGYDDPVETADGSEAQATKPKNVYCTREAATASAARENAPEKRLLEWINPLDSGDEIFLAYLSFSNSVVGDALCRAAERGVKVTFVLDRQTTRGEELEACGGEILVRGHQGSVGFGHIKAIMINPNGAGPADGDESHMKLSFGSGNMSSGTVLHHENWHFMEVNRESYFVDAHRCMMESMIDPAHTDGKTAFRTFMNECRADIPYEEEDDIRSFFIPVREDSRAITALVEEGIADASGLTIAAHRFGWRQMLNALISRLANESSFTLNLVADDDLYWLRPLTGTGTEVGPNSFFEADNVDDLTDAGGDNFEVRYLETNHSLHLLHHNKFIVFNDLPGRADAVLTGSPNLTGTGFNDNLENVYWIETPAIVDAYRRQFDNFWDGRQMPTGAERHPATKPGDMPSVDITLTIDNAVEPGTSGDHGLVINEILADPPPGYDANGDGVASTNDDEFIELINTGTTELDLTGATVSDGISVRVTFFTGTKLVPGQALILFGDGFLEPGGFGGAFVVSAGHTLSLNNGGDTVTVTAANGETLATATYGRAVDESLVRAVDGDPIAPFVAHTSLVSSFASPGVRSNGEGF